MTFDDAPLELRDDEDSALPIIDAGGEYRVLAGPSEDDVIAKVKELRGAK